MSTKSKIGAKHRCNLHSDTEGLIQCHMDSPFLGNKAVAAVKSRHQAVHRSCLQRSQCTTDQDLCNPKSTIADQSRLACKNLTDQQPADKVCHLGQDTSNVKSRKIPNQRRTKRETPTAARLSCQGRLIATSRTNRQATPLSATSEPKLVNLDSTGGASAAQRTTRCPVIN